MTPSGANSRVQGLLLPHARRLDTGVTPIAGTHRLPDDAVPAAVPAGPTTVLPPGPWGMFTAVWRGDRTRASAPTPPCATRTCCAAT